MTKAAPTALTLAAMSLALAVPAAAETTAPPADTEPPTPYVAEADLPEGFPMPGPAEQVLLKTYPTYRVAIAHGQGAFWQLFGHIQREGIPMTAPVTMARASDHQADAQGELDHDTMLDADLSRNRMGEDLRMGFLYPATDVGNVGLDTADNNVEVHDVAPMTVLSYGFFGDPSDAKIDVARAAIQTALPDRNTTADQPLMAAGPWRLLGYNGPSVPRDRRYYEVQLPVAPTDTDEPAESHAQPDN